MLFGYSGKQGLQNFLAVSGAVNLYFHYEYFKVRDSWVRSHCDKNGGRCKDFTKQGARRGMLRCGVPQFGKSEIFCQGIWF